MAHWRTQVAEFISRNTGEAELAGTRPWGPTARLTGVKTPDLLSRRAPRAQKVEEEGQRRRNMGHLRDPREDWRHLFPGVQPQYRFKQETYLLTDLGTNIWWSAVASSPCGRWSGYDKSWRARGWCDNDLHRACQSMHWTLKSRREVRLRNIHPWMTRFCFLLHNYSNTFFPNGVCVFAVNLENEV